MIQEHFDIYKDLKHPEAKGQISQKELKIIQIDHIHYFLLVNNSPSAEEWQGEKQNTKSEQRYLQVILNLESSL